MMVQLGIAGSGFYRMAQAQQAALRGEAEGLQRQIATGERLKRASDDPVAATRLRGLARADRLAEVEAGNIQRAREELGTSSDRLSEMAGMLIRARELVVLAANGSTSRAGHAAIADEVAALRDNLLTLANATGASGAPLFAGDGTGPAYTRAADGSIAYTGSATAGELEIGPGLVIPRGLSGPDVLSFEQGGVRSDVFAMLGTLEQALRGSAGDPAAAARETLPALSAAIDSLGRGQTVVGSRLDWVETVATFATQASEARAEETADVGGADLAATIARLQQVMTALEASQASFARLASISLFDRL